MKGIKQHQAPIALTFPAKLTICFRKPEGKKHILKWIYILTIVNNLFNLYLFILLAFQKE